jgi:DNA-binding LytR/AlgR family response regulator
VSNTSSCEFHTLTAVFIHNKAKPVKIIEKEFAFLGFIRTNYNVLVNLRYIDFIDPKLKMLTLKNGVKLQISIHRWRSVKAIFLQL